MRAEETLQPHLAEVAKHLDPRWWQSFWGVVGALLAGRVIQLTRLGRFLSRPTSQKHRIKAVDRLLGSVQVHAAVPLFYQALARMFIRGPRVVVLVDWTQLRGKVYAIVGAIPLGGRALPILGQVYADAQRPTRAMHRRFLKTLAEVLPPGCIPILVTDAGFQGSWMQDVAARGWSFVARLRHRTCVRSTSRSDGWVHNKSLHARATRIAKDLGSWLLGKESACERVTARLVLAKRPGRGRHRKGRSGKVLKGGISVTIRPQMREPWLLATNLTDDHQKIVDVYAQRMQIEQTIRDTKSSQFGFSFEHVRSTSVRRLEVLLLIAVLGFVEAVLLGIALRASGRHRRFQANTLDTTVLSAFQLGLLLLTTVVVPEDWPQARFRHSAPAKLRRLASLGIT